MSNFNKLQAVLKEIFELDKADLDFGIYRIINQKREDINKFLEKRLPTKVKEILEKHNSTNKTEIQNELKEAIAQAKNLGVDSDELPKVKALKKQMANATDVAALEQEVFSHLAIFFKRYYKDGDFISMRRYKKDVYAIPYEGEEVKLHWANHDQYYIKTTENLKNYAFKVNNQLIKFELKEANTEQNNNLAQNNKERRFAIYEEEPITLIDDKNLNINFTYDLYTKATKQKKLTEDALNIIKDKLPSNYLDLLKLAPTATNKKRTLLEKHLNSFTAKNTFDYFIHKDLGGFLKRELDFYIKNEVLYIDDIETYNDNKFLQQLSKIRAIKDTAIILIDFLAQIENFQKKIWLKKKFVIETNYCITLDKIPENYYDEILQNNAQIEEWKKLFNVDVLDKTQMFNGLQALKNEPFLVLDTKFFNEEFKDNLIAEFDDLGDESNGLMINSDNKQSLELISKKYENQIDIIYIDPPYNTEKDRSDGKFLYKDGFDKSSWITFIQNRILSSKKIQKLDGLMLVSIDDNELETLKFILNSIFNNKNFVGQWNWFKSATPPNLSKKIKKNIEYVLGYEKQKSKLKYSGIIKKSSSDDPFTKPQNSIKTLDFPVNTINVNIPDGKIEKGVYGTEKYPNKLLNDLIIKNGKNANQVSFENRFIWTQPKLKVELENKTDIKLSKNLVLSYKKADYDPEVPPNFINEDVNVTTTENAGKYLENLFDNINIFDYPKPTSLISYMINFKNNKVGTILDYFAGSGTTGHATIKLNREDNGNRKYILVEMGTYFNSVTKPRIQKVIYTDNWKNGKPQDKDGISQMFKYQTLESYEDALNNLTLTKTKDQQTLNLKDNVNDEYLINYMLDVESRDHLFNIEMFKNPFNYKLKVTENNELISKKVDLVETFNYLIGLQIKKIERIKSYKIVTGITLQEEKVLIVWRNLEETNNNDLDDFVKKMKYNVLDGEFDIIYVNGDHNLANLKREESQWKVKLIEKTFFAKMFELNEI